MTREKKDYPLELVLTHTGTAELRNKKELILWASDDDDDFKEEFPDFLVEDDFDDVLDFLHESEVLTDSEYDKFESEAWEMNIESLKGEDVGSQSVTDPEDDDDDGENEEFE